MVRISLTAYIWIDRREKCLKKKDSEGFIKDSRHYPILEASF